MVHSDEGEDSVNARFREVCADLNMDRNTAEESWQSFEQISTNYTLEGDKIYWLACALYVACRKSVVPTVCPNTFVEGNCVSLTRLLRSSKLSLIQFFKLMKKWSDMANLPHELRTKVDRIERNFAVSTVIFKKFEPIYNDIFKDPTVDPVRPPRSRKQKRLPCSSAELFSFCWTMFVKVKAHFTQISDDLVNSYHLLLSIMDLFFGNVLLANRKDLLNPNFCGLPKNFFSENYTPPKSPPCIIELLCKRHDGLVVEAKGIKEHWCALYIKRLFEKKVLKGNPTNFLGLIDPTNFETNNKAINKQYEEYVLGVGDFDERIFLGYESTIEIGTARPASSGELTEKIQLKRASISEHINTTKTLSFHTPLTGKRFLEEKEIGNVTPVSTATQSVNKLQTLLSGCKTCPSEELLKIFNECSRDPKKNVVNLIKEMGEKFCSSYSSPSEDHPVSQNDFARKRLQLGESLYYKILEKLVISEKSRMPSNVDLSPLFERTIFHQSLFACCLEIVLFSYNSQRTFPWIIEVFELPAYYFYKVIEVLIRAEEGLSRDVVKNLNHIEEQILECFAWKSDSPLWEEIRSNGSPLPSVQDVSLPSQLEGNQNNGVQSTQSSLLSSPVAHPAVRRLASTDRPLSRKEILSPTSPSSNMTTPPSSDAFHSSPVTPTSAKRRLFASGAVSSAVMVTRQAVGVNNVATSQNSGQVSITLKTVQGENGVRYLPITSAALQTAIAAAAAGNNPIIAVDEVPKTTKSPPSNKPKITGSLALFLRKGYHLASVRLRDLCDRLGLTNEDLRKKIWTCFEYSLMHHTELMLDRHLDQIMMCSIYVMSRVNNSDVDYEPMESDNETIDSYESDDVDLSEHEDDGVMLSDSWKRISDIFSDCRPNSFPELVRNFSGVNPALNCNANNSVLDCFKKFITNDVIVLVVLSCDRIARSAGATPLVTDHHLSFQEIMKCYRMQPQAVSHVYRAVLLRSRSRQTSGSSENSRNSHNISGTNSPALSAKDDDKESSRDGSSVRPSSALSVPQESQPPTPTKLTGIGTSFEFEDRGDIIIFYNSVYVLLVKKFAIQFSSARNESPPLSPLPLMKSNTMPLGRRVSNKHSIFISPLKNTNYGRAPSKQLSYSFNKSPRKDLDAINKMVKLKERGLTNAKRLLTDDQNSDMPAKRTRSELVYLRRIQNVINERQSGISK
ncbi:Retinoblastoma-like protein 1 [Nymphon striatum]|nr:Retinoblastoma-like protein 1 [Nymphon striatum]